MTDEELAEWEQRALATTGRVVVRPPREVESLQYVSCWVLADVILDMAERLRKAEARVKELEDDAEERRQEALDAALYD